MDNSGLGIMWEPISVNSIALIAGAILVIVLIFIYFKKKKARK